MTILECRKLYLSKAELQTIIISMRAYGTQLIKEDLIEHQEVENKLNKEYEDLNY